MSILDLARVTALAACGGELVLESPAGPARWSPARGWEDLRSAAGPGPWRLLDAGGAVWLVGAARATRAAPARAAAALDLPAGAAAPGDVGVADDGRRWALLTPGAALLGAGAPGAAPAVALPPPPSPCSALAFFSRFLVGSGAAGLFALDPADAGAGWRALPCDPPVRALVVHEGRLHYAGRTGARALEPDLAPARDARDWFRLDGGLLWGGPGGLVGLRDRLFVLAGTPGLRNWAPLPDPVLTVRTFFPTQVTAALPARSGVYLATRGSGLLFLPAGEPSWERVALPGLARAHAAEATHAAAAGAAGAAGAVFIAAAAGLWRATDVEGAGAPAPEALARALLVFPRGPDPALADSMVYPDGSGAFAAGAVVWGDAVYYAAGAVPGEQRGVLHRATVAADAPVEAEPPGPEACDVVVDAAERPWVVQSKRAVRLESLVAPPAPADPPEPDAIAVGSRPNLDDFRAAFAPRDALAERLEGRAARPISAIAFTADAAFVAVAGGPDTFQPIARRGQFIHRSRVVHIGLDARPESVVSIVVDGMADGAAADRAADGAAVGAAGGVAKGAADRAADGVGQRAGDDPGRAALGVRALAVRGRDVYLAAAFGLAAFRRSSAPGAAVAYEPVPLPAPGVGRPPYTHVAFVHAGRDRLLVDAFAWRRFGESHWHRWTGDELQRYEGRARVDLAHDPWSTPAARATLPPDAPPLPREPRPYLADHDPGWLPASPAPSGLPADSAAVTCALETDDALWIGTTAGLVRFDPAASAYALIGAARGLPTPRIVSVRPSAGYVLVSTIDGVFLLPAS